MESSSSLTTTTTSTSSSASTVTSELFICFTSRLSSSTFSSMKISSKSILSPGRARDSSQISLSSSLSRRLKTSGSLKGGQASPMFPAGSGSNNKKRSGVAFENPEPSSPKVTCIGQVRVKTKKQGKKMRSSYTNRSSKRRSNGGGEASFRRTAEEDDKEKKTLESKHANENDKCNCNGNTNQKWFTICEAVRAFGAELNCFLPCRSSCTTTSEKENDGKGEKRTTSSSSSNSNNGRSCGAAFARWLVALQDGDGKGREIELVVGGEEEGEDREERRWGERRSLRRRVFEGFEFKEEEIMKSSSCKESGVNGEGGEEEEKGRVSICIPPKNALLLMRCRSDPVKMAALANRFWDLPPPKDGNDENEDAKENQDVVEDEVVELKVNQSGMCEKKCGSSSDTDEQAEEEKKLVTKEELLEEVVAEDEAEEVLEDEQEKEEENTKRISTQVVGTHHEAEKEEEEEEEEDDREPEYEVVLLEQQEEEEENGGDVKEEEEVNENQKKQEEMDVIQLAPEPEEAVVDLEKDEEVTESHCEEEQKPEEQNEKPESVKCEDQEDDEEKVAEEPTEEEEQEEETAQEEKKGRGDSKETAAAATSPGLPECLLLMMCEPKLSMEVSKETWVCSTDFIRWLPERRRVNPKRTAPEDEPKKRPNTTTTAVDGPFDNKPAQFMLQPPRSSCSFPLTTAAAAAPAAPAAQSMASVIEQKLVGTKPGYEPFVLSRCKSEPMRSAAKLAPDACFWKNRKLEPHRSATLGVSAAGFGF